MQFKWVNQHERPFSNINNIKKGKNKETIAKVCSTSELAQHAQLFVLRGLRPHATLKDLQILGYVASKFPGGLKVNNSTTS